MPDTITDDEFFGYDYYDKGASSGWGLDSLLSTTTKLTNAAGEIVGAVGANKAAIANAKSAAELRKLQLTTGRQPATDFGTTLKQFLPWIVGLVVLAIVAAVVIPLVKSSSK
jgi:hypothetical protein